MKSHKLVLPVLLAAICVGFIAYYGGRSSAEPVEVSDAAVGQYTPGAAGSQYDGSSGAASNEYSVPDDIYYTAPVESVVFSHQTHAVEGGMKCDTCHTSKFEMKALNAQTQPGFNMQGLAEGGYCGACHTGNGAFSSKTQCARCHTGVKELEGEGVSASE